MKKLLAVTGLVFGCLISTTSFVAARSQVLGVHILHPYEINDAVELIKTDDNADQWTYITIPLSLDDLERHDEWQGFFDQAKAHKINPIVRLTSHYDPESNAWAIPTRADIMKLFEFLNSLTWPRDEKFIIAYNEPNHASEWGGRLDPVSYARVLEFVIEWAHTEHRGYRVLPAAMDLAAPDGNQTLEAFNFLNQMVAYNPHIFDHTDYWNSHSYPNPAFSGTPTATTKNSLRGFQHELAWLSEKTGLDRRVFITETGWDANAKTISHLVAYYAAAYQNIWSDERVIAVTPFLLRGDPGPFSGFTLLDANGQPTVQYQAYAAQIDTNAAEYKKLNASIPSF